MSVAELTPETKMGELLAALPGAQRTLFRLYHIGGCSSCAFRPEETVAELCARNDNLDPAEVLDALQAGFVEDQKLLISPAELDAERAAGAARILDIRTREEFDAVHLAGSRHFTQEMMQEVLADWSKDSLVVLVDHQGARSLDAAAFFAGHGFTNIKGLRGGIDAYSAEVDPSLPRYTLE